MADMGKTEVKSNDLVLSIVQETLREKTRLLPTVSQYEAPKGAQSVRVPRHDQFAAESKGENSGLTSQALTYSFDEITLDKQRSILSRVEDIASIQSSSDVNVEILKDMSGELAKAVDAAIISELKSASSSAPDHLLNYAGGAGAANVAIADIVNARKLLREQFLPMNDGKLWMCISPEVESNILKLSDFIDASKYGARNQVAVDGYIGSVLGFNVIVNANLSAADSLFYHSSAVGVAFSQQPTFETARDLTNVATEYLCSLIFGAKVMNSGKMACHYS